MASTVNETRADARASKRIRFEVSVTVTDGKNLLAGLARNLGKGGIFVSTLRSLPIGRPVVVEFVVPGAQVRARGSVRWTREGTLALLPGLGIAFDSLVEGDRVAIERFCAERPAI